jgi:hypothetical protein
MAVFFPNLGRFFALLRRHTSQKPLSLHEPISMNIKQTIALPAALALSFLGCSLGYAQQPHTQPQAPPVDYQLTIDGPKNIFSGSDLYLTLRLKYAPGSKPTHFYFGPETKSEGVSVQYICGTRVNCWTGKGGKPYWWGGNGIALARVTAPKTPGTYSLTLSGDINGNVQKAEYQFNVIPLEQSSPATAAAMQTPSGTKSKAKARKSLSLREWETQMITLGKKWCIPDQKMLFGVESQIWYYDGGRVYFQIADYTKDPSWEKCAFNIVDQYRDNLLSRDGKIQGWRVFPHGLVMAYKRTKDERYKQAVLLMAKNSAFAHSGGHPSDGVIRENSYLVNTWVETEKLGEPRNPLLARVVDQLLGHFDLYFRVQDGYKQNQTFYDGLAAEALINYYELTKDPRIPPTIKIMLDWMWEKGYNRKTGKLVYNPDPVGPRCHPVIDGGCMKYSANMMNLIIPAFPWYAMISGDDTYRERGDEMFSHSLDEPIDYSGKIFSQNYKWSFDFVKWRAAAVQD